MTAILQTTVPISFPDICCIVKSNFIFFPSTQFTTALARIMASHQIDNKEFCGLVMA